MPGIADFQVARGRKSTCCTRALEPLEANPHTTDSGRFVGECGEVRELDGVGDVERTP